MSKAIMIQGTGSNVGKSLIVAGLARTFHRAGLRVAPFKPQNMSNNAAVTVEGGEIGRAQALQARAAGLSPVNDMNPVLLKPETDTGAQVIVQGQRLATVKARAYGSFKEQLLPRVLESFHRLAEGRDLVLVEGAGSPAEINLRAGDIANMGFAEAADLPVTLVGDIDRGGVIAQMVGTHAILPPEDRARTKSFAINKFRGDPALFDAGMDEIRQRTGWAPLGLIPHFDAAWRLPAEDIMDLTSRPGGKVRIVVPRLNRIANFDDLDPLAAEPDVSLEIIEPGRALPGDAALVLLPGSKSTRADLEAFRAAGWHIDLEAHVRRGGHVIGLCGGYQMLGQRISDPLGLEGPAGETEGLGLLNISTEMQPQKALRERRGLCGALPVHGYEIHLGQSAGPDCTPGWFTMAGRAEGAVSPSGRVRGSYLHGIFANDGFRKALLGELGASSQLDYEADVDLVLDQLADHLERHLDLELLLSQAGPVRI